MFWPFHEVPVLNVDPLTHVTFNAAVVTVPVKLQDVPLCCPMSRVSSVLCRACRAVHYRAGPRYRVGRGGVSDIGNAKYAIARFAETAPRDELFKRAHAYRGAK